MTRLLAALMSSILITGCVTLQASRPDSSYYRILIPDCANKDAQINYLQRQLSREAIGPASEVRKQEAEIKRLLWDIRSTCQ